MRFTMSVGIVRSLEVVEMAKHAFGSCVTCPYYEHEGPQMIYCEGVEPHTVLHLAFEGKDKMREYRKNFCESGYNKCMIAQMLNRKWDYEEVRQSETESSGWSSV